MEDGEVVLEVKVSPELERLRKLLGAVSNAEQWLYEAMGDADRWAVEPILEALESCRNP